MNGQSQNQKSNPDKPQAMERPETQVGLSIQPEIVKPNIQKILPSKSSKNILIIIIASSILIIVFGVLLIYASLYLKRLSNDNLPTPTQTPADDSIADWKTYRDEKYGFEVKYPEDKNVLLIAQGDGQREFLFGGVSCGYSEKESNVLESIKFFPAIEGGFANPDNNGNYTKTECDRLVTRWVLHGRFCTNKNLTKYQAWCEEDSETSDYHRYDIYLTCSWPGEDGRIQCNQIFDQILSTFKFLPDISDWKTYTNTAYSYSFKYPKELSTQVIAAGSGTKEAPPNAISLYIYDPKEEEPYLNSYLIVDFTQLEPSYTTNEKYDIHRFETRNKEGIIQVMTSKDGQRETLANQILSTFKFLPDTSNWKTYTNEEVGFSLKYPENLNLVITPVTATYPSRPGYTIIDLFEGRNKNFLSVKYGGLYSNFFDIVEPLTNEQLVQETKEYNQYENSDYKEEGIFIDSIPAKRISYNISFSEYHFIKIYLKKNITQIEISADVPLDEKEQFLPVFNQILSTFKFLDKNPWEISVCGNGVCEKCESSNECCSYPCSTNNGGQEICPPPSCIGQCPKDCTN